MTVSELRAVLDEWPDDAVVLREDNTWGVVFVDDFDLDEAKDVGCVYVCGKREHGLPKLCTKRHKDAKVAVVI